MPSDESPASSFARVAAAAEEREAAGPPPPSAEELAKRALGRALDHLVGLGRYATHHATCGKDVSPEAVLAGKVVACSCGFDKELDAVALFVADARRRFT